MVMVSHLVHMVKHLILNILCVQARFQGTSDVSAELSTNQRVLVPHVEDTCTHAGRLILGDRPLGQTHFILDGVYGVGDEPPRHGRHVREPPVEQVADVHCYVEVGDLAVLGNVDIMW